MAQSPQFDAFPDNFDVARLGEPTAPTRKAFEAAFAAGIEPLASVRASRSVELGIGSEDSPEALNIYCAEHREDLTAEPSDATLNLSVQGEPELVFNAGHDVIKVENDQRERVGEIVARLAAGLPEHEASWLQEVWGDVQLKDRALVPLSVEQLLNTSPYPVGEHSTYYAKGTFNNGTSITGDWMTGNDVFMTDFPPDMPTRSLFIKTGDGQQYEYRLYTTGREELFVRTRGETVQREVDTPTFIESDPGNGLSVTVQGHPEFMRAVQAGMEERAEARQQGRMDITEGSLHDMVEVMSAAVASGLKQQESRPENN